MKARLPQGYGGGGIANTKQLLQQAQKMQEAMAAKQAELAEQEYTATAGGGVVTVKVNGKRELTSLVLKPEVVDPEDIHMLQDLVIAAVNEAMRTAESESAAHESPATPVAKKRCTFVSCRAISSAS